MNLYLILFLKLFAIAAILYFTYQFGKFLNTSNTRIGIWLRKKFGPTVKSAGHVIQREDLKVVGYCPVCGGAIKINEPVWLITEIPSPSEITGKLNQSHCLFYLDGDTLRVAVCILKKNSEDPNQSNCRGESHETDIIAVIGEDGKPVKKSKTFAEHSINKSTIKMFENMPMPIPIPIPAPDVKSKS